MKAAKEDLDHETILITKQRKQTASKKPLTSNPSEQQKRTAKKDVSYLNEFTQIGNKPCRVAHTARDSKYFSDQERQSQDRSQISERFAPQTKATFKTKFTSPVVQVFKDEVDKITRHQSHQPVKDQILSQRAQNLGKNSQKQFQTDNQAKRKMEQILGNVLDNNHSSLYCQTLEAENLFYAPPRSSNVQVLDSDFRVTQFQNHNLESQVEQAENFTPRRLLNEGEYLIIKDKEIEESQMDQSLQRHDTLTKKFNQSSVDFRKQRQYSQSKGAQLNQEERQKLQAQNNLQELYDDNKQNLLSDESNSLSSLNMITESRDTKINEGPNIQDIKAKDRQKKDKLSQSNHKQISNEIILARENSELKHDKVRSEIIGHFKNSSKKISPYKTVDLLKRRSLKQSPGRSECSSILDESNHVKEALKNKSNKKQFLHNYELLREVSVNLDSLPSQQTLTLSSPQSTRINQIVELNLRLANLKELNESIFLQNLFIRSVDVRNNRLHKIPDTICDLPYLWKIRLDYNYLTELPENLGLLSKLEFLSVSQNKISKMPLSLFRQKSKLSVLHLNDNKLQNLPDAFGILSDIKILHLHGNPLAQLPTSLHKLWKIIELGLDWFLYHFKDRHISKVQKDESGRIIIQELLRFLNNFEKSLDQKQISQQVSFLHYFMYFHKLQKTSDILDVLFSKRRTIFHMIALNGSLHLFTELQELIQSVCKADLNSPDEEESTALQLAIKNKRKDIIKHLLQIPSVNINKGSSKYGYPLHLLIQTHNFKQALKLIISDKGEYCKYVDVNVKNQEGNNALHILMVNFSVNPQQAKKVAAQLIKRGISVNSLNKCDLSPLHLAILSNQIEGVQFALDHNELMRSTAFFSVPDTKSFTVKNDNRALSVLASFQKDIRFPSSTVANGFLLQKQMPSFSRQEFDFNLKGGKFGQNSLQLAIVQNNLRLITSILNSQESINHLHIDDEGRMARDICPYNSPYYKLILQFEKRQVLRNLQKQETNALDETLLDAEGERLYSNRQECEKLSEIKQYHYNFRTQKQPKSFQRKLMHQKSTPNFYTASIKRGQGCKEQVTRNQSLGYLGRLDHIKTNPEYFKQRPNEETNFLSAREEKDMKQDYDGIYRDLFTVKKPQRGTSQDFLNIYNSSHRQILSSEKYEDDVESSDDEFLDEISNQDFQTQQKYRPSTNNQQQKLKRSIINHAQGKQNEVSRFKLNLNENSPFDIRANQKKEVDETKILIKSNVKNANIVSSTKHFKEDLRLVYSEDKSKQNNQIKINQINLFQHNKITSIGNHMHIQLKGNISSPDDSILSPQLSTFKSMSRLSIQPKSALKKAESISNEEAIFLTAHDRPLSFDKKRFCKIIDEDPVSSISQTALKIYQENKALGRLKNVLGAEITSQIFDQFKEEEFMNTSHRQLFKARQSLMNSGSFAPRIEDYQAVLLQQRSTSFQNQENEDQIKVNRLKNDEQHSTSEDEQQIIMRAKLTKSQVSLDFIAKEKSVEIEIISSELKQGLVRSIKESIEDDDANISDEEENKPVQNLDDPKNQIRALNINQTVTGYSIKDDDNNELKQLAYVKKIIDEINRCKNIQKQAAEILASQLRDQNHQSRNSILHKPNSQASILKSRPRTSINNNPHLMKNQEQSDQQISSDKNLIPQEENIIDQEQGDGNIDQSSMNIAADDCGSIPAAPMEEQFSPKIASAQKEFNTFKSKITQEIQKSNKAHSRSRISLTLQTMNSGSDQGKMEYKHFVIAILRRDQRIKELFQESFSNIHTLQNSQETIQFLDALYMMCQFFSVQDVLDMIQQLIQSERISLERSGSQQQRFKKQITQTIFQIALFELINSHQTKIYDQKKSLQHQILLLDRQKLITEREEYANKKLNIRKIKSIIKSPSVQSLYFKSPRDKISILNKELHFSNEQYPKESPVRKLRMKDYNSNSNTIISKMLSPSDVNSEVYNSVIASVLINNRMTNRKDPDSVASNQKLSTNSHLKSNSSLSNINAFTLHHPQFSTSIPSSSRHILIKGGTLQSQRQPPLTSLNHKATANEQFKFSTEMERLSLEETIISEVMPEITPSGAQSIINRLNFDSERMHQSSRKIQDIDFNYVKSLSSQKNHNKSRIESNRTHLQKTVLEEFDKQQIDEESEAEEEIMIPNKLHLVQDNKSIYQRESVSGQAIMNGKTREQSLLLEKVQQRQDQLKEKLFNKTHNIHSTISKYNLSKHLNDVGIIKANLDVTPNSRNSKGNQMMFGQLMMQHQSEKHTSISKMKLASSNSSVQIGGIQQQTQIKRKNLTNNEKATSSIHNQNNLSAINTLMLNSLKETEGAIKFPNRLNQESQIYSSKIHTGQLINNHYDPLKETKQVQSRQKYLLHHKQSEYFSSSPSNQKRVQVLDEDVVEVQYIKIDQEPLSSNGDIDNSHIQQFQLRQVVQRKSSEEEDQQNYMLVKNAREVLKTQSLSLKISPIQNRKKQFTTIQNQKKFDNHSLMQSNGYFNDRESAFSQNFLKQKTQITHPSQNLPNQNQNTKKKQNINSQNSSKVQSLHLSSSQKSLMLNNGKSQTQKLFSNYSKHPFIQNQSIQSRARQLQTTFSQKSLKMMNLHSTQNSQNFSVNFVGDQLQNTMQPVSSLYSVQPMSVNLQSSINTPLDRTALQGERVSKQSLQNLNGEVVSHNQSSMLQGNYFTSVNIDYPQTQGVNIYDEQKLRVDNHESQILKNQSLQNKQESKAKMLGIGISNNASRLKREGFEGQDDISQTKLLTKNYSTQSIQSIKSHRVSQPNLIKNELKINERVVPSTLSVHHSQANVKSSLHNGFTKNALEKQHHINSAKGLYDYSKSRQTHLKINKKESDNYIESKVNSRSPQQNNKQFSQKFTQSKNQNSIEKGSKNIQHNHTISQRSQRKTSNVEMNQNQQKAQPYQEYEERLQIFTSPEQLNSQTQRHIHSYNSTAQLSRQQNKEKIGTVLHNLEQRVLKSSQKASPQKQSMFKSNQNLFKDSNNSKFDLNEFNASPQQKIKNYHYSNSNNYQQQIFSEQSLKSQIYQI